MDSVSKQTLALAALAQAGFLVHQLAQHGLAAQDKQLTLIKSLFELNPGSVAEIYGKPANLRLGLQLIVEIIEDGTSSPANAETVRYLLGLLYLQQKLARNPAMLGNIRDGLQALVQRFPKDSLSDEPALLTELAKLYQDNISRIGKRIQVRGDMRFLQNDQVAGKVRVMLFAGIRAAMLWHQLGGKRWHLLFYRRQILAAAKALLGRPQL